MSSGMTAIGHVWPTLAMGYYTASTGKDINQFQFMYMLLYQGAASFKFWTGQDMPIEEIKAKYFDK